MGRPRGGGLGRPLPRRRAHPDPLPRVLLPAAPLLDGELRPLDEERGADAAERAARIYKEQLENYEQPPIDDAVRDALRDYVARRRIELGDEPIPSPAF